MKQKKTKNNLTYLKITLGIVVFVLILYLLVSLTGNQKPPLTQENTNTENNFLERIDLQGTYLLGEETAEVLMIEYSSLTCPFCKRYQIDDGTFNAIKQEYIDTGKIKYVYKHFTRNETDVLGANALECAGEQDAFFEYKKILYQNQTELQNLRFSEYAQQLNLDMQSFNECLTEQRYTQKIQDNKSEAIRHGITGTPGFLINGEKVSGAQPFSVFKQVIDGFL